VSIARLSIGGGGYQGGSGYPGGGGDGYLGDGGGYLGRSY